jgi:hypothetical protein
MRPLTRFLYRCLGFPLENIWGDGQIFPRDVLSIDHDIPVDGRIQ